MSDNDTIADEDTISATQRKMYYTISEASVLTGLDQSLLRSWEKTFSKLRPKKNSAGKRAYREKDIETVLRIKQLLFEEKYTIDGVRKKLAEERRAARAGKGAAVGKRVKISTRTVANAGVRNNAAAVSSPDKPAATASIKSNAFSDIRKELQDILTILES